MRVAILCLALAAYVYAFDCHSVVPYRGARAVDLSMAFADGPLTASLDQATPPSTQITRVDMDLCAALPRNSSLAADEQCPESTNVCMRVSNRRGHNEQVNQVVPTGGTSGGLVGGPLSYVKAPKEGAWVFFSRRMDIAVGRRYVGRA